ncbi:MAG: Smr/MutS family protein [Desulfarculales bacterium]|nr:Smr/MutS family protein [Desulfarculales bacterium]
MNKSAPFNNPFAELKQKVARRQFFAPPSPVPEKSETKGPLAAGPPDPAREQDLFIKAMQGVKEISGKRGREISPLRPVPPAPPPVDDDLEVMAHLAELVAGDEDMRLFWQRDFVCASSGPVSSQLLESLRAGCFPIQDYLDLHGLGVEEAMLALEKFLKQSRERGLRHVLLVHGKGKGSLGGESVLKETLSRRLCHKRFARWVLAFCSAQNKDGGAGAMYLLLKTWQGPTIFTPQDKKRTKKGEK